MQMQSCLTRFFVLTGMLLMLAGCKSELYSQLPERDANEMIAILASAGIDAERERAKDGTFSLRIETDQQARAIQMLSSRGLPRPKFESLGEIFDSKRMVSTPFEERARFMHAINQELSNSISKISGVTSARVMVMMPDESPLDRNKQPARASVFIYHHPTTPVREYIPMIKGLIVNSVNGLMYENVAVALFPADQSLSPSGGLSVTNLRLGNLGGLASLMVLMVGGFLVWHMLGRPMPTRR